MMIDHVKFQHRLLALITELRSIKDAALKLPENHVRVRRILTAIDEAHAVISKKVIFQLWLHEKQDRRASGR